LNRIIQQLRAGSPAAEQGNHEAQAKLASLYEKGRGVPHDLNRAYFWRSLSLDGGDSKQVNELAQLAHYMMDDDVADAERHASEWRLTHKDAQLTELDLAPPPTP
jgi:TPR repeat protein